jgi:hypothetical protein
VLAQHVHGALQQADRVEDLEAISGSITFSCSWPPSAATVRARSLPMMAKATWLTASGITGLTLPGMIELPADALAG